MTQNSAVMEDAGTEEAAEPATENETHRGNARSSLVGGLRGSGRSAADSAVKLKTLVVSALAIVVVGALCVLGWQLHAKSADLDRLQQTAADRAHAEQVALDYATAAANMDF